MNIAFVPVRCGSKSIPLKNIKEFCGKPLVYWVLDALQNSKSIDVVYVATDCDEIRDVVNDFNLSKVNIYNREKENSNDIVMPDAVMLEFIDNNNFSDDDLFLLVQATSPLTRSVDFDEALSKFIVEKSDSLLTCSRMKRFFWDDNNEPINYSYLSRPRRQDYIGILLENGAFYISNIFNIKKYKNRLGGKISIFEMEEYTAIEVDEEHDWEIAENTMYKFILNNKEINDY